MADYLSEDLRIIGVTAEAPPSRRGRHVVVTGGTVRRPSAVPPPTGRNLPSVGSIWLNS